MANDGGLSRFKARMQALPREVRKAVEPALRKSGKELARTMKTLAPEDTGALKDSIAVTGPGEQTPPYSQPGGSKMVPENAVAVTVGDTDVRYPHHVEYGTKKDRAQPFFWPSVRINRKRTTNRIKRAIAKAVRENWGGS